MHMAKSKSNSPKTITSKTVSVELPSMGSMGEDVAHAHATSNPQNWADKYEFDFESMSVQPKKAGGHVPAAMAYAAFTKHSDGSVSASIPSLAIATKPSYYNMSPSDFSVDAFSAWEPLQDQSDGKGDMRKSIKWWRNDPLVFNCVKFLSQMSNAKFTLNGENEDHRKLVENWVREVMPFEFRQQWFLEFFRTGMVPCLKTLIKYKPKALKDGKIPATNSGTIEGKGVAAIESFNDETSHLLALHEKAEASYRQALKTYENTKVSYEANIASAERLTAAQRAVASAQYEWVRGMIPGAYTILDPLLVDMDGPKEMGLLRQPYLQITGELREAVLDPAPENKPVLGTLPAEIIEQIVAGAEKVWLSPNICSMTFADKQPYERYPTPLCVHAFNALEMKDELISMDRATARTVKNRILLVKVGNDEYPEFDGVKIAAIQSMFNGPGRNMTFVWNHCIEMSWLEPNLDSLKDTEKYKFWNSEIRTVYGISPVLTGTSETSGSIGNSLMNFKGVEEAVEEAQGKFLEFFNREIKMLKAALGISSDITGTFDSLNTKDELKYWTVLTQAVMNGIIDHQTMLETLNFKFPIIEQRMAKMKQLQKKGLFVPMPSANNMGPDGKPAIKGAAKPGLKSKTKKPGTGGVGGKPANNPGAKNNSTRVGQSTPKKAVAKFQPIDGSRLAVVVEGEDLDQDHFNDIAERFHVPAEWVMSKASYEAQYGEIDMSPPWPALRPVEMFGTLKASNTLLEKINAEVEQAIATRKAGVPAGKRSSYITSAIKKEIVDQATASVLNAHLETEAGERPSNFGKYVAESIQEITDSYGSEMDTTGIYVAAFTMATARLKKLRPTK
jgi:hypothetical protein